MSWQTYVDDHLMVPLPHGGQLAHAAIVGQDGGVWAKDASFPAITVEETLALVKGCNDTSIFTRRSMLMSWCASSVVAFINASHIDCCVLISVQDVIPIGETSQC